MPTALGIVASAVGSQGSAPIPTSGLLWWWDADDLTTFTLAGSNVSQWRDKSGNGRHLSINLGNATRSTGTIKAGRGSVDFGGSAMISVSDGAANAKPFSVFAIIKHAGVGTYRAIIGCFNSGGLEWRVSSTQKQSVLKQYVSEIGVSTTNVPSNGAALIGLTYSATGSLAFRLNSAADNTVTNDQALNAGTNTTQVGDALGEPFTGSIGELIKYDRVITAPEIATIESYLTTKWK